MANIIKMDHIAANNLVKRIAILSNESYVSLSCGKNDKEKMFLQIAIASADGTRQLKDAVPVALEKHAQAISCVTKASDFCTIAGEILRYGKEEDLILEQIPGKLIIRNTQVRLDVNLVAMEVDIQDVSEDAMLIGQIYTKDLSHLLKDCGRFFDPDGVKQEALKNLEFVFNAESVSVTGCTGYAIGYDRVNAKVKPGSLWETAAKAYAEINKEEGNESVQVAVPGIFINTLVSALDSTVMEKVIMVVDKKYLHLKFDAMACVSVRLSDRCQNMKAFKNMIAAEGEPLFAIDKEQFEASIRLLDKKLNLDKAVGAGVPLHLSQKDNNLAVSVADNTVQIPLAEGSVTGLDVYLLPKLLLTCLSTIRPGNVLVKVVTNGANQTVLVLGNGTLESGYSDGATKTLVVCFNHDSGEQMHARFAAGKSKDDKDES